MVVGPVARREETQNVVLDLVGRRFKQTRHAPHCIAFSAGAVLGALNKEGRTVAEIGRRMELTRQSVQRTADRFEYVMAMVARRSTIWPKSLF
jgi:hypothetical protein